MQIRLMRTRLALKAGSPKSCVQVALTVPIGFIHALFIGMMVGISHMKFILIVGFVVQFLPHNYA